MTPGGVVMMHRELGHVDIEGTPRDTTTVGGHVNPTVGPPPNPALLSYALLSFCIVMGASRIARTTFCKDKCIQRPPVPYRELLPIMVTHAAPETASGAPLLSISCSPSRFGYFDEQRRTSGSSDPPSAGSNGQGKR